MHHKSVAVWEPIEAEIEPLARRNAGVLH
jgi:hypothetical protein